MKNIFYINFTKQPTNSPIAGGAPAKSARNFIYQKPLQVLDIEIITNPLPVAPYRVNLFAIINPGSTEDIQRVILDEIWVEPVPYKKIPCFEFPISTLNVQNPAIKLEVVAPPGSTAFNWFANIIYRNLV